MYLNWLKSPFSKLQIMKFSCMMLLLLLDDSLSITAQIIVMAIYFEIIWMSILIHDIKTEKNKRGNHE